MAFLPYDRECVMPSPLSSRDNAYPYAAVRILSLFADPTRSPDVAVLHTPRHFFPEQGGHVGEHGSLDVIQSRAPLLLSCLLYTSDAADDLLCVDLGGRRIIK